MFLLIWLINRIVGEERRREVFGAIKLCRLFVSVCEVEVFQLYRVTEWDVFRCMFWLVLHSLVVVFLG